VDTAMPTSAAVALTASLDRVRLSSGGIATHGHFSA
jgi:hypothetical protein